MSVGLQHKVIVLLAWAIIFGVSTVSTAMAQTDDGFRRGQMTMQSAIRSAKAREVAHERYRFVDWFESISGIFAITANSDEGYSTVLFPLGRSDRAYVLLLGVESPEQWHGAFVRGILCYQRQHGKEKLIYQVHLKPTDRLATKERHARKFTRIASILDFVRSERSELENGVGRIEGYALTGRISDFAKNDLAMKRDYVKYSYYFGPGELGVSLLSNSDSNDIFALSDLSDWYGLDKDPITNEEFTWIDPVTKQEFTGGDEFYKKYGLPIARQELPLFADAPK